jgi:hypothetical protein
MILPPPSSSSSSSSSSFRRSLPLVSRYAVVDVANDDVDCNYDDDRYREFPPRRPGHGGVDVAPRRRTTTSTSGASIPHSSSHSMPGGGGGGGYYALSLACACAIWYCGGVGGIYRDDDGGSRRPISTTLNDAMSRVPVLSGLFVGLLGRSGGGNGGDGVFPSSSSSNSGKKDGRKGDDDEGDENDDGEEDVDVIERPDFVYEHPYVSSSYYTSTRSIRTLISNEEIQVRRNLSMQRQRRMEGGEMNDDGPSSSSDDRHVRTRLAIVRPFCEFDAEALPTTFTCWNALPPCKAASDDVGDYGYDVDDVAYEVGPDGELRISYDGNKNATSGRRGGGGGGGGGGRGGGYASDAVGDRHAFDYVGSDAMKYARADVFLFYSQTYSENEVAIKAVDAIIDQFFEPGGWSQCFGNIYAIEANIPQELDLYIPSAQVSTQERMKKITRQ